MSETEIHVHLVDEAVDVWRPVKAEHLRGNIYRIIDQAYDRETETWQFDVGAVVEAEMVEMYEGPRLTAIRLHEGPA